MREAALLGGLWADRQIGKQHTGKKKFTSHPVHKTLKTRKTIKDVVVDSLQAQRGQLLRLRKPEDVVKSNPSLVGWFLWDVGSGESKASPGFRWSSKPGAALGELSLSSLLQRHLQANTAPGQRREAAGGWASAGLHPALFDHFVHGSL